MLIVLCWSAVMGLRAIYGYQVITGVQNITARYLKRSRVIRTGDQVPKVALTSVSAQFPGGITALAGPSGCGKSTLMQILSIGASKKPAFTSRSSKSRSNLELVEGQVMRASAFADADVGVSFCYIDEFLYESYDARRTCAELIQPYLDTTGAAAEAAAAIADILNPERFRGSRPDQLLESARRTFEVLLAILRITATATPIPEKESNRQQLQQRQQLPPLVLLFDEYFDKAMPSTIETCFTTLRTLCEVHPVQVICTTHNKQAFLAADHAVVLLGGSVFSQAKPADALTRLPTQQYWVN